jgi:elongation factor P
VEDSVFNFLYADGEGYHFMEPQSYEQITVTEEIVGDSKVWLQDGMSVHLSVHNGVAIAIELPQKVTVEIMETEPVVKGQTASSSYKPAMADNGVRVMVPPHIGVGTRVVVNTEDATYVERAKD